MAHAFLGSSGCPSCSLMESRNTAGIAASCLEEPFSSRSLGTNYSRVRYRLDPLPQFLAPNRTLLRLRPRLYQLRVNALQKGDENSNIGKAPDIPALKVAEVSAIEVNYN